MRLNEFLEEEDDNITNHSIMISNIKKAKMKADKKVKKFKNNN